MVNSILKFCIASLIKKIIENMFQSITNVCFYFYINKLPLFYFSQVALFVFRRKSFYYAKEIILDEWLLWGNWIPYVPLLDTSWRQFVLMKIYLIYLITVQAVIIFMHCKKKGCKRLFPLNSTSWFFLFS